MLPEHYAIEVRPVVRVDGYDYGERRGAPTPRTRDLLREEWGRLLALLVAQYRRLDLAEDGLGDAFEAAARTWPGTAAGQPARVAAHHRPAQDRSTGSAPRRWRPASCPCSPWRPT